MKRYFLILALILLNLNCYSQYLIDLVKIEDIDAIKKYSGDFNVRDKNKATPLMWAIYYSNLEMAQLLISKGANPFYKGIIHEPHSAAIYGSCMAVAAGKNKVDILDFLIKKIKIPVDDQEITTSGREEGWNALQWASFNGCNEAITYLKKKGKAKINRASQTDNLETPLHFAASNGHLETVKLLVKYKADVNVKSAYGYTPLDKAYASGHKEIMRFLFEKGGANGKYSEEEILEKIDEIKAPDQVEEEFELIPANR